MLLVKIEVASGAINPAEMGLWWKWAASRIEAGRKLAACTGSCSAHTKPASVNAISIAAATYTYRRICHTIRG